MYPDGDVIPNIDNRVIFEKDADIQKLFAKETAGISEHPALQVFETKNENDVTVFLEKLGVTDPEQVKVTGCSFTANALRNIIQDPSDRPDLIIHRGLHPIVNTTIQSYFLECIQLYFLLDLEVLKIPHVLEKLASNCKQIIFLI